MSYTGDGLTDHFSVPFSYILKEHVKIYIDNVLYATGADTDKVSWLSAGSIQLATIPSSGAKIKIKRETPVSTKLVDFQNTGVLDETALDTNTDQLFNLVQEVYDNSDLQIDEALSTAAASAAAAQGYAEDAQEYASIANIASASVEASEIAVTILASQIENRFSICIPFGFTGSSTIPANITYILSEFGRIIPNGKKLKLKRCAPNLGTDNTLRLIVKYNYNNDYAYTSTSSYEDVELDHDLGTGEGTIKHLSLNIENTSTTNAVELHYSTSGVLLDFAIE